MTRRSNEFDQNGQSDLSAPDVPFKTSTSEKMLESPSRRKEELHEKLALLNSRYVYKGEKHEKSPSQEPNSSKVGLAAIQDMAARQEAVLHSEDVTPTNDMGFLRYDPTTNSLSLEHEPQLRSPTSPLMNNSKG